MKKETSKQKTEIRLVASETPWGKAQLAQEIGPGIIRYSTASHGGYYLYPATNAKVPPVLKQSTCGGLGLQGWYEEDCDWAIVVYTFKDYFNEEDFATAVKTLEIHHKQAWTRLQRKTK